MTVKLLTEHHLEFLRLKGGYTGLSEFTLVKIPHCWKSHVTAQISPVIFSQGKPCRSEIKSLSSGFPTKRDANQSPQLKRLARALKFCLKQVYI